MKYKLLSVNNGPIQNIGDYIQALASSQFLPSIDGFINREELNKYDGERCAVIMNGWYMHNPKNWPPSDSIIPHFVAFHLNSSAYEMLSPQGLAYLKRYEPIGCRDKKTAELLKNNGIKSYFSACMTLTLGYKYHSDIKTDNIYFVDPFYRINKKISKILRYLKLCIFDYSNVCFFKNKVSHEGHSFLYRLFEGAAFFDIYRKHFDMKVLKNATYICQQSSYYNSNFQTDYDRLKEAERLVKLYASAKYVVTSRIHCALPCLGLGTPVVFTEDSLQPEVSSCRFGGIKELFNVLSFQKDNVVSDFGIVWFDEHTVIVNKPLYKKYAKQLFESCEKFIKTNVMSCKNRCRLN